MPLDLTIEQAYQQITGFNTPNPMQRQVWNYFNTNEAWGLGLLLKGPTGSGKTETIAVPTLADLSRRLVMAYPTRSLVDDQIGRFHQMLARRSEQTNQELTLVVDTGAQSWRYRWREGRELAPLQNPRRHLYDGNVIITTLDKFLYRFFGFGEPGKSYIYPLRMHYSHRKMLVCFDEAHAYDDVAFTNFARLVRTMYEKGLDVALMTATMPEDLVKNFNYLEVIDFTSGENEQSLDEFNQQHYSEREYPAKQLTYLPVTLEISPHDIEDEDPYYTGETEPTHPETAAPAIAEIIKLAEQRINAKKKKRLIVTVETVRDTVFVFKALREKLPDSQIFLYHGRLGGKQRKKVYEEILKLDKENGSYTLISTSAIEVGCDLNAHTLITQLCDPERLIQRAGRCNRKQEIPDAEVIVVGDTIPDWLTSLDPAGLADYLAVLQAQNGQTMDVGALTECIRKTFATDYRTEMMFDMLYEYVYEARLENKPLHDKGLLFTRSWEPTITLYTEESGSGKLENAVEVPISRCVARKEEQVSYRWEILKRTFNRNDRKPETTPPGPWECAYTSDLIAQLRIDLYDFDEIIGHETLPKLFNYSYRSGYRRFLVREDEKGVKRIWYLDNVTGSLQALLAEESSTDNDDNDNESEEQNS